MTVDEAAEQIQHEAQEGRLDPDAVASSMVLTRITMFCSPARRSSGARSG
jgi:hypothetical protein